MKKLVLLACAGFFLFAPVTQLHVYGVDESTTTTTSTTKTDSDVVKNVNKAFTKDSTLAPFAKYVTVVQTDKGVVVLSGSVPTEKAKNDFGSKAKNVSGVSVVQNDIVVDPTVTK